MNNDPQRIPESCEVFREEEPTTFMRSHAGLGDTHGDPMEAMGNLFDVAILIGVGFMVVALSSFGLKELLSDEDLTIVKNPGTEQMEIITKEEGKIKTLKRTDQQAQGQGKAVGTVYQLEDGRMVWIPGSDSGGLAAPGAGGSQIATATP